MGILFFDVLRESKAIHSPPTPGIIYNEILYDYLAQIIPVTCAAVLLHDIQRTLTVRTAAQYTGSGIDC